MDDASLVKAALMGAIAGLTELLPVSGDTHLAIAGAFVGLVGERLLAFRAAMLPAIVLGAMAAGLRRKAWDRVRSLSPAELRRHGADIAPAFVPILALTLFAPRAIQGYFFNAPAAVVMAFLGGLAILRADQFAASPDQGRTWCDLRYRDAIILGLLQCAGSLLPGIGRSCGTVVGGLALGLSRRVAVEVALVLSLPSLLLLSGSGLGLANGVIGANDGSLIAVGAACSLVAAYAGTAWLLDFFIPIGLVPLAWYRFAVGFAVVATMITGGIKWTP